MKRKVLITLSEVTTEFHELRFVVKKVTRRFDPPMEIPPGKGWSWHYECFATVYMVQDIDPNNAVDFFGYRVDEKYYTGRYVEEGLKYRVYHIGGGCIEYGIETIEKAIELADELLEGSLQRMKLSRNKNDQDLRASITGQQLLYQEFGDDFPPDSHSKYLQEIKLEDETKDE
jgi:hypothetical protein